ncbi:MAG: hypothetical protein AMXMBFR7_04770 [Planctomycetota bacterium]
MSAADEPLDPESAATEARVRALLKPSGSLDRVRARLDAGHAPHAHPESRPHDLWVASGLVAAAAVLFLVLLDAAPPEPPRSVSGSKDQPDLPASGEEPKPPKPFSEADVRRLVALLADENPEVREQASQALSFHLRQPGVGRAFLPLLKELLERNEDLDARARLQSLIAYWTPGLPRWSVDIEGLQSLGSLSVQGGWVYVSTGGNRGIQTFDTASGKFLWSFPNHLVESEPAISEGLVFINATGKKPNSALVALEAQTGTEVWRQTTGGGDSSPLVVNGRVYCATWSGTFLACNSKTGEKIWDAQIGPSAFSAPAWAQGLIVVGLREGGAVALDAETGAERWRFNILKKCGVTPLVAGERVFVAGDEGIFALNLADGKRVWAAEGPSMWRNEFAYRNGMLIHLGAKGRLRALDAKTGHERWRQELGGSMFAGPIVLGETILAGTRHGGALAAFDVATGARHWTAACNGCSGLAVSGDLAFVASSDNKLHAIYTGLSAPEDWPMPGGNPARSGSVERTAP